MGVISGVATVITVGHTVFGALKTMGGVMCSGAIWLVRACGGACWVRVWLWLRRLVHLTNIYGYCSALSRAVLECVDFTIYQHDVLQVVCNLKVWCTSSACKRT